MIRRKAAQTAWPRPGPDGDATEDALAALRRLARPPALDAAGTAAGGPHGEPARELAWPPPGLTPEEDWDAEDWDAGQQTRQAAPQQAARRHVAEPDRVTDSDQRGQEPPGWRVAASAPPAGRAASVPVRRPGTGTRPPARHYLPPGPATEPGRDRRILRPLGRPRDSSAPAGTQVVTGTGRPVRHRDPDPASQLAAEGLAGHLVITASRVIAWYRLPLQRWSFRPQERRLELVADGAARLAQLTGRRCHLRITSRPYPVWAWAHALDQSARGGGRQVLPGPCQAHPLRSEPGCPSCVPGAAWVDWLQEQQQRIRQWGLAEREVYLGVEVSARGAARQLLGQNWARAADAERASMAERAAHVTAAVAGPGLHGRPVTPDELHWLFVRSCGIGLPAPLPIAQHPAPAPFALPAQIPAYTGADDVAGLAGDFPWTAEPFGRAVEVRRAADGLTAYVTALTVADMTAPQDLDGDWPWIARTDRLPFEVEWSVLFDCLDPRRVQREMSRQADKIRHQYAHITMDHGQEPPPAMERQMEAVRRIGAEAENPDAAGTRVYAWARLAVAGDSPQQARERAGQAAELYAPAISLRQPPDQYKVLREFIPGEPLASAANRRFLPAELLMGGVPAATAQVGHRHGFPLGYTTSLAVRAVTWHPWHAMEHDDSSGLVTITGTLGGGKSSLAGLLAYMTVRAGIPVTVLDPSGMLDRLCQHPHLAPYALAANVLESPPGTLCPYRLIPDPPRDLFAYSDGGRRLDESAADEAWQHARQSAAVQRRTLTTDILRMLLPPSTMSVTDVKALREAVRRAPAGQHDSPAGVIDALHDLHDYGLGDSAPLVARELEGLAEHPLARLFFPAGPGADGVTGRGRLLTVMTLRGLVIPGEDRRPEERTAEEQLSIPVLHLAAQLLRRQLLDLPRGQRKAAILDEAHMLTRDPVGRQQINEMARESRKNNLLAVLISQNPDDLLTAGIANLKGAAFAFKTTGAAEAAATCSLLRIPEGRGHEERLGAMPGGHCLFADGQGGCEQIRIDLGAGPGLAETLNTTPGGTP